MIHSFYNMTADCAFDVDYMYKPSFGMEWKASPIQGRTLCKGKEDAGETAAFPEEEQIQMHRYILLSIQIEETTKMQVKCGWALSGVLKVFTSLDCSSTSFLIL